nr:integrase, catalytic region, zinc finger, CCHC-type, peptidase aspartic, catalytic [Tanacetum cinerariifolium]
MHNNSQGKKQQVEDHRINFKFSNNKTFVTACNDSWNANTSNVNFVCVTYGICVLNDNHDMCVLHYINGMNSRTKMPKAVPINTREPKRTMNQSAATPLKRTVVAESTNQKLRSTIRKQYEQISKTWLNHNLFTVGQYYEVDSKVAFRKSTCYIRDLKGNDLLTGSRGKDMYSITLQDTPTPNPFCLMAKATLLQAWLWHRRLSHLNFDTIYLLSKYHIVTGLSKLKFIKDHLCSSCELGKAKCKSFKIKTTPSSKRRLQILHMDLCGPMRVESFNGKKYVLVIVDDYSRYTWTQFLRSKDETPEVLIDFLKLVQRGLHAQAEAIATTCFTQNRSLVISQHEKTPYHIINGQKSSVKFFHIFGSLCYIVRDGENLDKMKEKGDACIFVRYSTQSRAYRAYNKITRVIVETIHVNFDELPQMASDHVKSNLVPQCSTMALEHASLSLVPQSQENVPQAAETVTTSNELDFLFSPMFDELLNGTTLVVSKSFAVTTDDTPNQRQQQHTTPSTSTTVIADTPPLNIQTKPKTTSQAPTVTANENIIQAETNKEYAQVDKDEFINIFKHRWTKDHPLEQVIRNPSQSIRTRRQLETYGEICMFALTVSRTKPKKIKEAMADSAWIESMQEELHQFDRLDEGIEFKELFALVARLEAVQLFVADGENLDKMKEKGDECIFVGYSTQSRAYRVFNKRTRVIMESIHVNFNELPQMASVQISSDPAPECQTMALEHNSLSPGQPHAENDQVADDEFINIFLTPIQDQGETSSRHVEKGDACIFVGYSNQSRAYRVFNKRTRVIMESIHVNFDELPQMASIQISSDPAPECQTMALEHDSLSTERKCQENVSHGDKTVTTLNELDFLFSPMFDELLNGPSQVVSKYFAVPTVDECIQRQQLTTPLNNHTTPDQSCQVQSHESTVTSNENINQAELNAENDQVADDEFINIFSAPVQDQGETSLRHVDSSNMHTFYQRYPSEHRWTKDHPLEQVLVHQ